MCALKNPPLERVSSIWAMRDSNPRHPRCKRGALPTELIALNKSWTLYRISRVLLLIVPSVAKKPLVFTERSFQQTIRSPRGVSSAGRALQSHCRGQGFEFPTLHTHNTCHCLYPSTQSTENSAFRGLAARTTWGGNVEKSGSCGVAVARSHGEKTN